MEAEGRRKKGFDAAPLFSQRPRRLCGATLPCVVEHRCRIPVRRIVCGIMVERLDLTCGFSWSFFSVSLGFGTCNIPTVVSLVVYSFINAVVEGGNVLTCCEISGGFCFVRYL